MKSQRLFLSSVMLVCLSGVAAAQRPSGAGASHPQPSPKAAPQATNHPVNLSSARGEPKNFTGVAKQLGTTPQALEEAYKTALLTNPKLTRGQFIAANMVAKNLSGKYPNVTADAILDGLKNGKSIGQSLQDLGVPAGDAKAAETDSDGRGGHPAGKEKGRSGSSAQ